MNGIVKSAIVACFAMVAGYGADAAYAAPRLTQQQCRGYPFVKPAHEITHRQLMNELGELEAVGYTPDAADGDYPGDVRSAEHRLHVEYRQDCLPATRVSQRPAMRIAQ